MAMACQGGLLPGQRQTQNNWRWRSWPTPRSTMVMRMPLSAWRITVPSNPISSSLVRLRKVASAASSFQYRLGCGS